MSPFAVPTTSPSLCLTDVADYRQLFDLSLDLFCIADLDGHFKRVNPSWTRVLGWSEAELLSRPVESFMHPEDRERTLAARATLARGTPVRGLENRYLCRDGSYRWLSWQSSLAPGSSLVYAVARDITERRQLEHERLVVSKLESTGILAAGIAHDFNNLLSRLLLNLEALRYSGPISPAQASQLGEARQAIQAAGALTRQLIAFAEGGAPSRRIHDVCPLLRDSLETSLRGSDLVAESVIAPDLWEVDADEDQLRQVIRGLVLNAREASHPGATVRLRADNHTLAAATETGQPAGDYLRIRIEDDGVGIPAESLPKIFDPYFSTKQRGTQKGMGLGLTICRTIVRKHGGAIAVESLVGHGTVVTVDLPAQRPAPAAP
ncbi:PAS/PAC sensor signal transduction histidine kinase [Opitutus terrae PB90-1]|uniref:histidine kinase n=1 Tax=Opitutus terrae (strain DSM 11246 / JCM 15787 / PB90-1) TaxID=452637 RepID=B1ZNS3_OPITP|nr:PAS/PAC sensor signal transduction histidine kinase [Opitutus terrae PB90-1]